MGFSQDPIRFNRYQLDPGQGLTRGSEEVRLTPKSLQVLGLLASRAGQVVTKEEIFGEVWPDTSVTDSALTSCIQELRHALDDDAKKPQFIETLHRRGYRFVAPVAAAAPLNTAPLVGREPALETLRDAYSLAQRGQRQLVVVTGEAGIGKTSVARAFLAADMRSTWGQCVEHYGIGEPYEPLLDALTRLCRQRGGERVVVALQKFAPSWLAQMPGLSVDRAAFAGVTRERMLRELTDAVEAITSKEPLVILLEDLHWSDVSTIDWLTAFAQRPEPAHILIIGTLRPSAVNARIDPLRIKRVCREIPLGGLDENAVAELMAMRYPGDTSSLAGVVQRRTEGNPLFVTEVLSDLAGRGVIVERDGRWTLTSDATSVAPGIPDDVRRMIQLQLDRLSEDERVMLSVAAVIGLTFNSGIVAAAAQRDLTSVESILAALDRQHHFVRKSAAGFEFLHTLYRDVIYDGIAPAQRSEIHRRVGDAEELVYGERASEIAAELAMHFEQSPDIRRAIMYRQYAAENARRRGAGGEARAHLERALALLGTQRPSSERTETEIALRTTLGGVIMATGGFGAADAADQYTRARALAQEIGDAPRLFPAMWGLWLYFWARGQLGEAQELANDLLARATRSGDRAQLLQARHAMWATAFTRGALDDAIAHAEEGMRLYDRAQDAAMAATYGNHDAGMCARSFAARALAMKGDAIKARLLCAEAVALSRDIGHDFSLALAYYFAAAVEQTLGDPRATLEYARTSAAISRKYDFRLLDAWATVYEGWASGDAGLAQRGIEQARATGSDQFMEEMVALLEDVSSRA